MIFYILRLITKGELEKTELQNWFKENLEKNTFELNDNNFEHDTQAGSGSTTGDWFIILYVIFVIYF